MLLIDLPLLWLCRPVYTIEGQGIASRNVALHLRLKALMQSLELVHVSLLRGPTDAEALLFVGLGNLAARGLVELWKMNPSPQAIRTMWK